MDITEQAFDRAKLVLRKCSTSHGMNASGGRHCYNMVFARDAMIGLIGASCADRETEFKQQFKVTLSLLKKHQSSSGQIPGAIDYWDKRRPKQLGFATIDGTLWYLLGLKAFEKNYRDKSLGKSYEKSVGRAFCWLRCQDAGEDSLPEQLPTSDWQDCFPHKYGHTINTIALYYACLQGYGKKKEAARVRRTAKGMGGRDIHMLSKRLGYFLPWQWKNHDGDVEMETWFDSLGNCLALCSGFATKSEAESILGFIEEKKINKPFPLRAIYPPLKKGSPEWHTYFEKCIAKKPHCYINGGIWPYIGGFYVGALVRARQFEKAEQQLLELAKANRLGAKHPWEFNEWIHPQKKRAMGGSYHAWSAGAYLFAFKALEAKRVPLFL